MGWENHRPQFQAGPVVNKDGTPLFDTMEKAEYLRKAILEQDPPRFSRD